ncbi:glyoxalase/bleomycin resistance protein/dioxygenase [Fibrella aestuarina BUZ 2]|uniref:Glyoxalase/bleomycin resistance protein/dioxygenase n=1 Tax=Fibrella aestuarina BUZ 2 TaxID=1166018 RepID=I0KEV3_9BACT|nr:VOC family protein [Fibrella aestuarina]CCH02656.1 glyoxalase/bleomycin resistance protein/dioxygenase [Fibrella aestuarina BUZ 2]
MRIDVTSLLVADQARALAFYTDILGFQKKRDIPLGDASWLTVVSPDRPDGVELLLEPTRFEPAQTFQKALYDAGIPLTVFAVDDVQRDYERLLGLGVVFSVPPTQMGPVRLAVFDDTCGNRIQLAQTL